MIIKHFYDNIENMARKKFIKNILIIHFNRISILIVALILLDKQILRVFYFGRYIVKNVYNKVDGL